MVSCQGKEEPIPSSGFGIKKKQFISFGSTKKYGRPSDFKNWPIDSFWIGRELLHRKFGPGEVTYIENKNPLVVEINFSEQPDSLKRMMLRFAKFRLY